MTKRLAAKAVLFDLDGTLLDTAPDLAYACNIAVGEVGLAAQSVDALKPYVSGGAAAMLTYSLRANGRHSDYIDTLLPRMLTIYEQNIAVHTRFFAGMERLLEILDDRRLAWGIVTNKAARFTEPLLRQLRLDHRAACVISGDTMARNKPDPMPMYEACRRMERRPDECVYIGDARRDIEAGRNAGMPTLAAAYGYIPEDDPAHTWGAHGLLEHPGALLDWLAEEAA